MTETRLSDYLKTHNELLGVRASLIDIVNLPDHKLPEQVRDEIPTLNKFGYMKFELEEFSQIFLDLAATAKNPVLEIGTAYGWVTHKVLEAGVKIVAADISIEHLEVLLKKAPQDKLDNLFIAQGFFPSEIDFPDHSFEVILISRVLHFLEPSEVEQGLDKLNRWLTRDGKLICTNCSIYHSSVKNQMLETFKQRIADGDKWAGVVRSHAEQDAVHEDYSQPFFNAFFQEQLEELLPKHGFQIEKINYFDYPSDHWPDEGKGHIGFVAKKV